MTRRAQRQQPTPEQNEAVDAGSPSVGKRSPVRRLAVQRKAKPAAPSPDSSRARQIATRGVAGAPTALPHLETIQRAFGDHDVRGVRAHVGGDAEGASDELGADAFAVGNDVAFASTPDLHTAAHEAAHVVQQRGGVQLSGGVGAAGDVYEQHADRVADLVVGGYSAADVLDQAVRGFGSTSSVQLKAKEDGELTGQIRRIQDSKDGTKITINRGSGHGIEPGWSVQLSDGSRYQVVEVTGGECTAITDLGQDTLRGLERTVTFVAEKKSRKQRRLEKKAVTAKISQIKEINRTTSKVQIRRGADDGFNWYWKVELLNEDGSPRMDGEIIALQDNDAWISFAVPYSAMLNSSRMLRLIPY